MNPSLDSEKQLKESRNEAFRFVSLNLGAFSRLASVLEEEAEKILDIHGVKRRPKYTIEIAGGSRYETSDPEIFSERKMPPGRLMQLQMCLYCVGGYAKEHEGKHIHIAATDTSVELSLSNSITVEGWDSIWVNGITERLMRVIVNYKTSYKFFYSFVALKFLLLYSLLFLAFWSIFSALAPVIPYEQWFVEPDKAKDIVGVVSTVTAGGLSSGSAVYLALMLQEAFPRVELRGNEPSLAEPKRRAIKLIGALIVLPIVINILTRYL